MRMLVTGAGGFLGRYVVAAAVRRGHTVKAMIRPVSKDAPEEWLAHPQVEIVRGDLRRRGSLDGALGDANVVLHLAASKSGDLYEQFGGTVIATENLLAAMTQQGLNRLVVTSSFSVYEYLARWAWGRIDEHSPLARNPFDRDEYCQTKLEQERVVREHAQANGWQSTILRPGVIYGRDNLWTARLGMQVSERLWMRIGAFAPLPLTYVENCAEAIVLAGEREGPPADLTLNVVDDDPPTQRAYLAELRRQSTVRPRVIPVPWTFMRAAARLATWVNGLGFRGGAKVPGIFVPARLHARCKPMRYSNAAVRDALGWKPAYTWREGIRRSLQSADPATLEPSQPHSRQLSMETQKA